MNNQVVVGMLAASLLFLILSVFIILFVIMFQKRRQQHTKEMTELQHNYEQALLRSQLEIQEETLRNISLEIHDNIGQVLSLAKLQLNTLPTPPHPENQEIFATTKQLVSKAITDLRSLSKSLHPDRVNELGLEENIRHELDMLEKTRQYETHLKISGSPYKIPVQTQTILFRIVQESISNIIKHAGASRIDVALDYEPARFCLTVQDNGVGIGNAVANADSGIGLKNMHHRSAIIGAQFSVTAGVAGGTIANICLPVES
jgi:two-component system, NarL family, sensor kinase